MLYAAYYDDRIEEAFSHLQRAFAAFPRVKQRFEVRYLLARDLFAILGDLLLETGDRVFARATLGPDSEPETIPIHALPDGGIADQDEYQWKLSESGLTQLELIREDKRVVRS